MALALRQLNPHPQKGAIKFKVKVYQENQSKCKFFTLPTESIKESSVRVLIQKQKQKQPSYICLFKVNSRNTRKWCEICSKLTIKTPERCHSRRSGDYLHLFLVFLLLSLSRYLFAGKYS